MTSPPPPPTTTRRPRRESRFTEGDFITQADTPTSNELFFTILSQMDEHEEKRRKRNNSNSSVESFVSSSGSPTSPNMSTGPKETVARRSVTFGRRSGEMVRRSLDERPREGGSGREALADKVKGRLRALTGERRKDAKPYPGT